MSDYMFINMGDKIPGTAKQAKFLDFVEVHSFSHGCSYHVQPGQVNTAGTSVSHDAFTITKNVDKATPETLNHLNQRLQVPKIEFHMLTDDIGLGGNAGGKKLIFKVTLEDCRIINVSYSGSDGAGMPIESVSIAYGKVSWWFDESVSDHDFRDWSAGK